MFLFSKKYILIIIIGSLIRFFLSDFSNFEPVTSIVFVSGSFLGGFHGFLAGILIMFFSDLLLGNTFVITWVAFGLIGIFGSLFKKNSIFLVAGSITSVLFFYLFTNFWWWLFSGMYSYSFSGLIESYILAIPFLRNQLLSLIFFLPFSLIIHTLIFEENKLKLINKLIQKI